MWRRQRLQRGDADSAADERAQAGAGQPSGHSQAKALAGVQSVLVLGAIAQGGRAAGSSQHDRDGGANHEADNGTFESAGATPGDGRWGSEGGRERHRHGAKGLAGPLGRMLGMRHGRSGKASEYQGRRRDAHYRLSAAKVGPHLQSAKRPAGHARSVHGLRGLSPPAPQGRGPLVAAYG